VFAAALAIAALAAGAWVMGVAAEAPAIEELEPIDKGANSVVFAADGTRLGVISSDTIRRRVPLKRISEPLQEATVAIEDADFYEHGGIDLGAIVRAAVENAEAGEVVQGGSTITQQLVKNVYTGRLDDRDLEAKIHEAKLASELERRLDKDQILARYLNTASYGTNNGRTAIGVDAAARQYFDKPAAQVNVKEAALIAGLPQAPSLHNPLLNREAAKRRRNEVLRAMAAEGYISEQRARTAAEKGLGVNPTRKYDRVKEQYFFDYVTEQLIAEYGAEKVREGGLEVKTTIDLDKQRAARAAIDGNLAGAGPSAAIVTTDVDSGNIVAMVSNADYGDRKFNLAAQGRRQPGSAFKTMVLAAAVRKGADPDSTYYQSRSPMTINDSRVGSWEVNTFDGSGAGTINLRQATTRSDNTVYAQLGLDVDPAYVRETATEMGITSELHGYAAEAIGGLEQGVTPLEMANAYGTLAGGGVRQRAQAITEVKFPDGRTDGFGSSKSKRAFSDGVAAEVTDVLRENVDSGTGTRAKIDCPQAGKTGTTDDFHDAWFVGYTPKLSTAVWVGYPDEQTPMRTEFHGGEVAGGTFPAQIWGDYMRSAASGDCGSFPEPDQPFNGRPFSGTYAKSSGSSS
jgi:penicillin-binding protein 1A